MKLRGKLPERQNILYVIVNVILLFCVVVTFVIFINRSQERIRMESIEDMQSRTENTSQHLYSYLKQEEDIVTHVAAYIEQAQLNEEEMVSYLEFERKIIGELQVISQENYATVTNPVLKELCESLIKTPRLWRKGLRMTEPFTEDGKKMIAFYDSVIVGDCSYLLLNVVEIEGIIEGRLEKYEIEMDKGFLMNLEGEILSLGKGFKRLSKATQYYDYIGEAFGKEQAEQIKEQIQSTNSGNFRLRAREEFEWVSAYRRVEGTPDWVYVCLRSSEDNLLEEGKAITRMIITFLIIIMVVNGSVVYIHHKELKRSLATIGEKNRELEAAVEEAERANQAKSRFLSSVSHEIRTPINTVLGLDEMILRESTEPEIQGYASNIRRAGNVLLGLVNEVLDFSKIESGKMEITPSEYDVGSLINDMMCMLDRWMKDKKLAFSVNVNPQLPHLLYGDELRIKQIILNILTNAVKYTEKGGITFMVDYQKLDENTISLVVKVKDTGVGMRPEEVEKLFQPFERLDEKRNRSIEGTGLGMSIVKQLLELMDSKLEVESVYRKGSEISFSIEQKVLDWEEVGKLEESYHHGNEEVTAYKEIFHAPKAKILVVDDTDINLTVVKGLLKQTRIQIDTAESGAECLRLVQQKEYQMIFLDHRMPQMDGVETLHHMKEMEHKNQDVPVIALTANVVSGAREYYIQEGFSDFISKPVNGVKLEKMILKYLPDELVEKVEEASAAYEAIPQGERDGQQMAEQDIAAGLMQKLEKIPEIFIKQGLAACGSMEVYLKVAEEFANSGNARIRELETFYQEGNIRDYTIKVHALKNNARLVGAIDLSRMAEAMEQAGDRQDMAAITQKNVGMLQEYERLCSVLSGIFQEQEQKVKKSLISQDELQGALLAVKEFAEAFDFDNLDAVMEQLETYELPEDFRDTHVMLKQLVLDVEQKKIIDLVEGYLGGK